MAADAVPLPEGTVTVLSTDLVGSTLLNQRLGDAAATGVEREVGDDRSYCLSGCAVASIRERHVGGARSRGP